MRLAFTSILLFLFFNSFGQSSFKISGTLLDEKGQAIGYATSILKSSKDSSVVKVEMTDESGRFLFEDIASGSYFTEHTFVGLTDFTSNVFALTKDTDFGSYTMSSSIENIEEVTVSAKRALIEVKSDRSIFNVQGTINTNGENGLSLLRKAPGVRLDNNNNISVLGRAGVLVYIDGKRLPLSGDDLTNYLQSLTSEQIDRIEIITNPGAKYEAQGNAGIIDIRLKKDKNLGMNGTLSAGISKGREWQRNIGLSANYRTKKMNIFGNANASDNTFWNAMDFLNFQNGLLLDEENRSTTDRENINLRLGTDFYLSKKSTLGFLVSLQDGASLSNSNNRTLISKDNANAKIDSILVAPNKNEGSFKQNSYNINYAFDSEKWKINIDGDYASFDNTEEFNQPNLYYNSDETSLRTKIENNYNTPSSIKISTAKIEFETKLGKGKIEFGGKLSNVVTDNVFNFYNFLNNENIFNTKRSNKFVYDENVSAVYTSYNNQVSPTINLSAGLRAEHTNATGDLTAYEAELEEEPVNFNYWKLFPNVGLVYSKNPMHSYSLKYGRRINRPDYAVLNPFREQLSELSFSRGNKNLRPEIVNNVELSYTLNYMYNFSLSYSLTNDQITRLIGPDDIDSRAGFISWDNLATQKLYSLNASIPATVNKWWSSYFNFGASYTDNQADYGTGGIVDVQAYSYNIYQQQSFSLPNKWKAEVSGWFAGPGVWGGVFLYETSYSLDIGIQRKFFNDKINAKLSASDITYQSGWSGVSVFNGLKGEGRGNWDSRRVSLSLSYDFGNSNVKSRKRNTSAEDEINRVKK